LNSAGGVCPFEWSGMNPASTQLKDKRFVLKTDCCKNLGYMALILVGVVDFSMGLMCY